MSASGSSDIDSLIQEFGNCGIFQLLIVTIVYGAAIPSRWSASFMMYGNYNPGWICNDTASNTSISYATSENYSLIDATSHAFNSHAEINQTTCEVYKTCSDVIYSKAASTIVTEWNLACHKSYILSLMLSLQSGGFTIGIFISGVLSNAIGRKPTHFLGLVFHIILNAIAMFSYNWPMFTVCRFFIGISSGSITVTSFMYPMEFVTNKWRAIVTSLPVSNLGTTTFALTAMTLKDWRMLHLLTAVVSAALLLSAFWIPESIRWLALKGDIDKVVRVTRNIAKWNGKEDKNIDVTYLVTNNQRNPAKETNGRSFLDLYRHGLLRTTVITSLTWISIVVCYTVVLFDIKSLSGNLYVNIILFSVIPCIILPFLPYMANNLGRKLSSLILFGLSCVCCTGLLTLDLIPQALQNGIERIIISILFVIFIDGMWGLIGLYVVELYPTSVRSLGYSHASCLSRIGGMLAAFLVPHDETTTRISHVVTVCLLVVSWGSVFLLPETKDRHLEEKYIALE